MVFVVCTIFSSKMCICSLAITGLQGVPTRFGWKPLENLKVAKLNFGLFCQKIRQLEGAY